MYIAYLMKGSLAGNSRLPFIMSIANDTCQPAKNTSPDSMFRTARILISDSDVLNREIISRKLKGLGYTCGYCENSLDVLDVLTGESYDLLLTALPVNETGCVDFLKKVLKAHPGIAVILITSVVDIEVAVDALKYGAYDYITIPFNVEDVSQSVSRALKKRRLLIENKNYQRTLEEKVAKRTRQLEEALNVLERTYHSTLVALSKALDSRDADSDGYTLRVTLYAKKLARQLGMPKSGIRIVEQGVLLHDVGTIGIPENEEEQILMYQHPEIGFRILSRIKFLEESAQLVLQHHERYDGQGYPQGLKGDEINLGARIFAVADAFESLTFSKSTLTKEGVIAAQKAVKAMAGAQLDPMIVDTFLAIPFDEWQEMSQKIEWSTGMVNTLELAYNGRPPGSAG
ncbi:MAG: HD domain-containing phosphohydrolase [Acidobacteriota bacterium]